jgi:hypothetical protein
MTPAVLSLQLAGVTVFFEEGGFVRESVGVLSAGMFLAGDSNSPHPLFTKEGALKRPGRRREPDQNLETPKPGTEVPG